MYNYGELGHFWVKGYENLRVMEYQIAILRDKYEYLGEKYCTEQERKLAMLRDFPPLNYLFIRQYRRSILFRWTTHGR